MPAPDGARLPDEQIRKLFDPRTQLLSDHRIVSDAATEYAASYYEAEIAENWRHINLLYDQLAEAAIRVEPYRTLVAAAARVVNDSVKSLRYNLPLLRKALAAIREMEGATLGDDDASN